MPQVYQIGKDKVHDYEFGDEVAFLFIVYDYTDNGYDGEGEAVGLHKDGKLYVKNLCHCSCYGPNDGGMKSGTAYSVEDYLSDKDDIMSYDATPSMKTKVRELLKARVV